MSKSKFEDMELEVIRLEDADIIATGEFDSGYDNADAEQW